MFCPYRLGLAIGGSTTRSGLTEIGSCGMPCSGPVPNTPTDHMMTFMVDMHMAARPERCYQQCGPSAVLRWCAYRKPKSGRNGDGGCLGPRVI